MKKILLILPLLFWIGCEDDQPPSAVDLTFKVIGTNVILEWTKNSDGDFDSYEIVENGPFGDTTIYNTTDNNSTLFLRQANSCEYYHYEVVVTNESGKSTSSNTAEVFTGPSILFEAEQNNYYQIVRLDSDGEAYYLTELIDLANRERQINYSVYDDKVYFLTYFGSKRQITSVSILGGEIETVYEADMIDELLISGNGKRLIFLSDGYLTYLDIETGEVNQVGNYYAVEFAISDDGTSFAVSDGGFGIVVVDENGTTANVPAYNAYSMDWSSDGNQLVFHYYDGNSYEIATIEKNGTNFQKITDDPNGYYYKNPTFINNDTQIMYDDQSADWLVVINTDGSGAITIAEDMASGNYPYYSVSECLTAVVYRHQNNTLLAIAYFNNLLNPQVLYTPFTGRYPSFQY